MWIAEFCESLKFWMQIASFSLNLFKLKDLFDWVWLNQSKIKQDGHILKKNLFFFF